MRKISKTFKINRKRTIYVPNKSDKVIHAKINKEIRNKYNIKLMDRDTIIQSIIGILTQGDLNRSIIPKIDFTVIRSDIRNFFPSIDKHRLYRKISQSNILKKRTLDILKPLFFNKEMEGIPLGFPFSSSLSEIYMEQFDEQINYFFNPIAYFRYVDDIILILYCNESISNMDYKRKLINIAKSNDLEINMEETQIIDWTSQKRKPFNYLGYSFKKEDTNLTVDISKEKYHKVAKRIRGYFYDYNHSSKEKRYFWVLYYQLKNRIYGTTSDTEKNLKYGLGFSYRYINTEYKLKKLINLISYNIRQLKLTSYQRNTLFSLISFNECRTEILKMRINYNRFTYNQLRKICRRLDIPIFQHSSKSYQVKRIFHALKHKTYKEAKLSLSKNIELTPIL